MSQQNSSDEMGVKHLSKKERRLKRQRENDLRYVLNDERGRRFIWRLLGEEFCRVSESICVPDNPYQTYFNSGQQDIGHMLQAEIIKTSPAAYLKMQNEQMSEKEKVRLQAQQDELKEIAEEEQDG